MSTALQLCRRSQLLGAPVFARGNTARLGLVTQVWVDLNALRVVGCSIRRDLKPHAGLNVPLSASQLLASGGLLVEPEGLSQTFDLESCSRLVPQPIVTQSGIALGNVKDFTFDMDSGAIATVRTSGTGIGLLPPSLETTFEILRSELVLDGSETAELAAGNGLQAKAGAEERLVMLKRGLLEQVGVGKFDWSQSLSASQSVELDEATLDEIATVAASSSEIIPLQPGAAVSSEVGSGEEQEEETVSSKGDATAEDNDLVAQLWQGLSEAIAQVSNSAQPLLLKLPQPLRDKLGLAEPKAEATPAEEPAADEDSTESEEIQAETAVTETAVAEKLEDAVANGETAETETSSEDSSEEGTDSFEEHGDSEDLETDEFEDVEPETPEDIEIDESNAVAAAVEESNREEPKSSLQVDEMTDSSEEMDSAVFSAEEAVLVPSGETAETAIAEEESQPDISEPDETTPADLDDLAEYALEEPTEPLAGEEPEDLDAARQSEPELAAPHETDDDDSALVPQAEDALSGAQVVRVPVVKDESVPEAFEVITQQADDNQVVLPASSTSLPRMPKSRVTNVPAAKPITKQVALPQTSGRVPKAGGFLEPKVKGS